MELLWFLLSAAVIVQARPDWTVDNIKESKDKVSDNWISRPEFISTEDETKPNPNFVMGDRPKVVEEITSGVELDGADIGPILVGPLVSTHKSIQEEIKPADSENRVEAASTMRQRIESSIINIDATKPITAELSISFHPVRDPAPTPEPTCINNWGYCHLSTKPCCGQKKNEDGTLGPKYWTCFEFGEGICTPLHEIVNLDLYAKLISELNSTNFNELHEKYWQSHEQTKDMSIF